MANKIRYGAQEPEEGGLHRYAAVMPGAGYIWLGIYDVLLLAGSLSDVSYDSLIHVFFVGFVMNMIFAHAPIILPGVAKMKFYPYHPLLYIYWRIASVESADSNNQKRSRNI